MTNELIIKDCDLKSADHWPVEVVLDLRENKTPGFSKHPLCRFERNGIRFQ